MKGIYFRGIDENGNWQYGLAVININDKSLILDMDKYYVINTNTICRYVGIEDCNGNKIFEGDVVKIGKDVSIVKWEDEYGRFVIKSKRFIIAVSDKIRNEVEVIGNIFENGELVKEVME